MDKRGMTIGRGVAALAVACMAAVLPGCSGKGDGAGGEVSSFEIREELKTASKSYRLAYESGDTAYLTLSATVQWPVKLGEHPLIALQDSILGTLGTLAPYDIGQAMTAYVNNVGQLDPEVKYVAVDSVPLMTEDQSSYDISTTVRVMELNEQTVTYQVYNYSFTGGAHPNYAYSPFTYDLASGEVLTFASLFRPGSEEALLPVVEESLADQMGVTGRRGLARAGVFTDQLHVSRDVFVSDGQIVFHYNPYDIGPYALGSIDVPVAPFVVDSLLTPEARRLLID